MDTKRSIFQDLSLWFLLLSNVVTIYFAITEGWNLKVIVLIYLLQSFVIGVFNVVRLLQLQEYSTEGFEPLGWNKEPKIEAAEFFALHYSFFHLLFLGMLFDNGNPKAIFSSYGSQTSFIALVMSAQVIISVSIFTLNHAFSYFYNKPFDTKKLKLKTLYWTPYIRMVPVILLIYLATNFKFVNGSLLTFLVLKTIADILTHVVEHAIYARGGVKS